MDKQTIARHVEKARAGDAAAFEALYNECANLVYYTALKILQDHQLAEDITQEVFIAAFKGLASLKKPESFPAWVKRIAAWQCAHLLRGQKDTPLGALGEETEAAPQLAADPAAQPEQMLEAADTRSIVASIVDTLPQEQRAAVVLYYFNGLSVKSIAEALGVGQSSVKSRLQYARRKIKQGVKQVEAQGGIRLHGFTGPLVAAALLGESTARTAAKAPPLGAGLAKAAAQAGASGATKAAGAAAARLAPSVGFANAVLGLSAAAKLAGSLALVAVVGGAGLAVAVAAGQPTPALAAVRLESATLSVGESAPAGFTLSVVVGHEEYSIPRSEAALSSQALPAGLEEYLAGLQYGWAAVDSAVAAVQDGSIAALAPGSTTLTLTVTDGAASVEATATIVVLPLPESITLPGYIELEPGESLTLQPVLVPADAAWAPLEYHSSDSAVAAVNQTGLLQAKAAGQTVVTLTSGDVSASVEVTVRVPVLEIQLDAAATVEAGQTLLLEATLLPENAMPDGLLWSSLDESIATVDQTGLVKALAPGKTTIRVEAEAGEEYAELALEVVAEAEPFAPAEAAEEEPAGPANDTGAAVPDAGQSQPTPQPETESVPPPNDTAPTPVRPSAPEPEAEAAGGTEAENLQGNGGGDLCECGGTLYYEKSSEPGCEYPGTDFYYCSNECGRVILREGAPPAGHQNLGEWEVVKEPTETEPGLRRRYCSGSGDFAGWNYCGYMEEEEIPPLGTPG